MRREFTITISGYVEEPNGETDVANATKKAHDAADLALRSNGGEAMDSSYEMRTPAEPEDQASELRRMINDSGK